VDFRSVGSARVYPVSKDTELVALHKDSRARETERGYRFGINDDQLELFQATDDESIG